MVDDTNPLHFNSALKEFIQSDEIAFGVVGVGSTTTESDASESWVTFPLSKVFWNTLGYVSTRATVKCVGGSGGGQTGIDLIVNLPENAPEGLTFSGSLIVYNADFSEVLRKAWSTGPRTIDGFYDAGVDFTGDAGSVGSDLYVGTGDTGNPPASQQIFSHAGGVYFITARIDTVVGWPA